MWSYSIFTVEYLHCIVHACTPLYMAFYICVGISGICLYNIREFLSSIQSLVLAGLGSGLTEGVIVTPFERVKVHLQAQKNKMSEVGVYVCIPLLAKDANAIIYLEYCRSLLKVCVR